MTILWFIDRFGLPGHYHRVWVKLMRDNYVPINEVRIVSLHKVLKRQLLTRHGTRKAPTWIQDEGPSITRAIDTLIEQMKPRAVVLTAPESLACLGLAPEHATLHSLRGSVYWRSGVPHLVMLPMSAWFSLVSQKEIGAANYGFESQEALAAARSGDGQVSEQGAIGVDGAGTGAETSAMDGRASVSVAAGFDSSAAGLSGNSAGGSRPAVPRSERTDSASAFDRLRVPRQEVAAIGTRRTEVPESNRLDWPGHSDGRHSATGSIGGVLGTTDSEGLPDRQLPGEDGGGVGYRQDDSFELVDRSGLREDPESGPSEFGDAGYELADSGGLDDDSDSVPDAVDESESGLSGATEEDADAVPDALKLTQPVNVDVVREDGEMDQFFYEPILSPVGRFVLTADTQKLFRILRDGKNAAGPSRPIEVNWR